MAPSKVRYEASSIFKWLMPHAPRSQSRTSLYFRSLPHPSTAQSGFCLMTGGGGISDSKLGGMANASDIFPSMSMPSLGGRDVDTQRYIVGTSGSGMKTGASSTSISSSPLSAFDASALGVGIFPPCFARGRDCFFSKRLMVSAYLPSGKNLSKTKKRRTFSS